MEDVCQAVATRAGTTSNTLRRLLAQLRRDGHTVRRAAAEAFRRLDLTDSNVCSLE